MTKTIDIIKGQPVPDVSHLDASQAVARQRELEKMARELKDIPGRAAERKAYIAEIEAVAARLRELKEIDKRENMRRNFAGIGSPLHEAIVARLDADTVAELEAEAMRILIVREQRATERRAKKEKQ